MTSCFIEKPGVGVRLYEPVLFRLYELLDHQLDAITMAPGFLELQAIFTSKEEPHEIDAFCLVFCAAPGGFFCRPFDQRGLQPVRAADSIC